MDTETTMKNDESVLIRIHPNLKIWSERVFKSLGLNLHAGVKLFLTQMTLYRKLPFDVSLNHFNSTMFVKNKTSTLLTKIDKETKQTCVELTKQMGISLSTVITMYLIQVVDKQAIPFEILTNEQQKNDKV